MATPVTIVDANGLPITVVDEQGVPLSADVTKAKVTPTGSSVARALGALLGAFNPSPTLAVLGDSITAAAQNNLSGASVNRSLTGYVTWALMHSRQRLLFPEGWNFGISGQTSGQIADRVSQVIAVSPGYCMVLAGTNDLPEPGGPAWTIANLKTIYDALQDAGIYVIAVKILPRAALTTAQYGWIAQVNAWIEAQKLARRNFAVVDATLAYVDIATGSPKAALTSDGLHPLIAGSAPIGKVIADVLNQLVPTPFPTFSNLNDKYHVTDNPTGNLVTNGLMTGTTGTVSNGVTGTLPTGYSANGSSMGGALAACSQGTWPDGRTYTQIDFSGTVTGTGKQLDIAIPVSVPPAGAVIEASCEVELLNDASGISGHQLFAFVNGTPSRTAGDGAGNSSDVLPSDGYGPLPLRTPRVTVGVSPTAATLTMRIPLKNNSPVSGSIRFGAVALRKL